MNTAKFSSDELPQCNVGLRFFDFSDTNRKNYFTGGPRPLRTVLWYPTNNIDGCKAVKSAGPFAFDAVFPKAALPSGDSYPIVLLSHGTGGSAMSLSWLAIELARNGYVVAGLNHHGNTGSEKHSEAKAFLRIWDRATDVSLVIDNILQHDQLGRLIDASQIYAAGFSLGAYTVLATAGVTLELKCWQSYCEQNPGDPFCRAAPEFPGKPEKGLEKPAAQPWMLLNSEELKEGSMSYRDERIKAVAAMAPVGMPLYSADSVGKITTALALWVAESDEQALASQARSVFGETNAVQTMSELPGAGHYSFLCRPSLMGRFTARRLFSERAFFSRKKMHWKVSKQVVDFLNAQSPDAERK